MAEIRGDLGKYGITVSGLNELQEQFLKVGKMPKKYLTKAAREGMAKPLRDAKANAPVGETGMLKKGIKQIFETPNKRNKAVYRLSYNPKYTDHYKKPTTGVYGGKTPEAYYPNSVEYGYKTAKGRVEGQYFGNWAVHKNQNSSLQIVIDSINDSISTLLK